MLSPVLEAEMGRHRSTFQVSLKIKVGTCGFFVRFLSHSSACLVERGQVGGANQAT